MRAILRDARAGIWRLFERPRELVVAHTLAEVVPCLEKIEEERARGAYAAGFVSYEASPAFDPALAVREDAAFPLLWFGLYDGFHELSDETVDRPASQEIFPGHWTPSISFQEYSEAFHRLHELILSGETYQVNFTFRLSAHSSVSPWALFQRLVSAQRTDYAAYLHAGEWVICSASPELFFERRASRLVSKPMKGTAPRGLWYEQDRAQADRLRAAEKERAENVMIVDMVRNDLGRIARPGSVEVSSLFDVERYPTVWQMTSTVEADTDATLAEVFSALFPPASITGAPKASTMGIIAGLEDSPRRIYTGTIGFVDPDGRAQFNVAIRTALINRKTEKVEYGIGGGIVADSDAAQEFAEAQLKAKVLQPPPPEFDLLESMLWTPREGYTLLHYHLTRLMQSAEYFGFDVDLPYVQRRLAEFSESTLEPRAGHAKVRLLVSKRGAAVVSSTALAEEPEGFGLVRLASEAIDQEDPFLYHKTTNRHVYDRMLALSPGASDVLLFNTRGEVTESTRANVIVEIDGELFTPPVEAGLLRGTARAQWIELGKVRERTVRVEELDRASRVYLLNSVRGLHPINWGQTPMLTVP